MDVFKPRLVHMLGLCNLPVVQDCTYYILCDCFLSTIEKHKFVNNLSLLTIRYEINWGDGAISSGLTAGHVSPLQFTRTYSSDGQFSITLNYCSNSVDNDSNCCSEKSFQLDVTT